MLVSAVALLRCSFGSNGFSVNLTVRLGLYLFLLYPAVVCRAGRNLTFLLYSTSVYIGLREVLVQNVIKAGVYVSGRLLWVGQLSFICESVNLGVYVLWFLNVVSYLFI